MTLLTKGKEKYKLCVQKDLTKKKKSKKKIEKNLKRYIFHSQIIVGFIFCTLNYRVYISKTLSLPFIFLLLNLMKINSFFKKMKWRIYF